MQDTYNNTEVTTSSLQKVTDTKFAISSSKGKLQPAYPVVLQTPKTVMGKLNRLLFAVCSRVGLVKIKQVETERVSLPEPALNTALPDSSRSIFYQIAEAQFADLDTGRARMH